MNHTITGLRPKNRSQIIKQVAWDCFYLGASVLGIAVVVAAYFLAVAIFQ